MSLEDNIIRIGKTTPEKIMLRTDNISTLLLSRLTKNGVIECMDYTIEILSNSDNIKFNYNLDPISIHTIDIFIYNLGQVMHGVITKDKTITITYSAHDYLKVLGYIPKYNPDNAPNILEYTRLYSDTVYRFVIEKNHVGGLCYKLIKSL